MTTLAENLQRDPAKEGIGMDFKKMFILCVFVMISLFPISVKAQMSPAPDAIPEGEVRQIIDQYVNRFKAMDLDLFIDLFSKRATENRMLPYADIRQSYRKIFAETNQFLYYPTIYSVKTEKNRAMVMGWYKMVQTLKEGNRMRVNYGNIQWALVREDGALKIMEITFGSSSDN